MRKSVPLVLLILTSFLVSGCMKVVVRVNDDGSGTYELAYALSPTQIQQMQSADDGEPDPDTEFLLSLLETPVTDEESGITFSAEERIENGQRWTYVIAQIPDLERWQQIQAAILRTFPEDEDDEEDDGSGIDQDELLIPMITLDGSTLRVDMTIPGNPPDPEEEEDMSGFSAMTEALITVAVEVDLAGSVVDHNGQVDSLTGNLIWFQDPAEIEPTDIYVISELE